ncbi:MAG TPA: hypothetical protein VFE23_07680 [Usitatibacter sp.]|nr:hypothetical protein [Usitatibacter sp.]
MGRNIETIIAALPKERRARINKTARKMAGEMVSHANSLAAVRKVFSKTQVEVGEGLDLPQNAISQLEKRKDLRISTLVRYVGALGGELDLVIRLKDGSKVVLTGIGGATARNRKVAHSAKGEPKRVKPRGSKDTALSRR